MPCFVDRSSKTKRVRQINRWGTFIATPVVHWRRMRMLVAVPSKRTRLKKLPKTRSNKAYWRLYAVIQVMMKKAVVVVVVANLNMMDMATIKKKTPGACDLHAVCMSRLYFMFSVFCFRLLFMFDVSVYRFRLLFMFDVSVYCFRLLFSAIAAIITATRSPPNRWVMLIDDWHWLEHQTIACGG